MRAVADGDDNSDARFTIRQVAELRTHSSVMGECKGTGQVAEPAPSSVKQERRSISFAAAACAKTCGHADSRRKDEA